jgi:hypothetical protein
MNRKTRPSSQAQLTQRRKTNPSINVDVGPTVVKRNFSSGYLALILRYLRITSSIQIWFTKWWVRHTFLHDPGWTFAEAERELFNGKYTTNAIRSQYFRSLRIYRLILSFERFIRIKDGGGDDGIDDDSRIESHLKRAGASGIEVTGLSQNVIIAWYRNGWYKLFNTRCVTCYCTTSIIARSIRFRYGVSPKVHQEATRYSTDDKFISEIQAAFPLPDEKGLEISRVDRLETAMSVLAMADASDQLKRAAEEYVINLLQRYVLNDTLHVNKAQSYAK